MDKKYEFLKKYIMKKNGYIRLLSLNEIDNNLILLPEPWFHIFKEKIVFKSFKGVVFQLIRSPQLLCPEHILQP